MEKNEHSFLVNNTLVELGKNCRDKGRFWKNATGAAMSFDGKQVIQYGLKGSPDIIGILANGKFIGIECKTGSGKQSKVQKNFEVMIKKFNGIYLVVKKTSDAIEGIENEL